MSTTSETESDSDVDQDIIRSFELVKSPTQEDLVPLLECPVCFDLPLPPIRTCYQGHIICADCSAKVHRCPLCQKPIGIGRNFFAEDFLNRSTLICKYAEDGCMAQLPGSQIKAHIPQCHFRPIKCQRCSLRVPFSEFDGHMLRQHSVSRWDLNDQGTRIIQTQKLRSRNSCNLPIYQYAADMIQSRPGFLIKGILVILAISFIADQFIGAGGCFSAFESSFWFS